MQMRWRVLHLAGKFFAAVMTAANLFTFASCGRVGKKSYRWRTAVRGGIASL